METGWFIEEIIWFIFTAVQGVLFVKNTLRIIGYIVAERVDSLQRTTVAFYLFQFITLCINVTLCFDLYGFENRFYQGCFTVSILYWAITQVILNAIISWAQYSLHIYSSSHPKDFPFAERIHIIFFSFQFIFMFGLYTFVVLGYYVNSFYIQLAYILVAVCVLIGGPAFIYAVVLVRSDILISVEMFSISGCNGVVSTPVSNNNNLPRINSISHIRRNSLISDAPSLVGSRRGSLEPTSIIPEESIGPIKAQEVENNNVSMGALLTRMLLDIPEAPSRRRKTIDSTSVRILTAAQEFEVRSRNKKQMSLTLPSGNNSRRPSVSNSIESFNSNAEDSIVTKSPDEAVLNLETPTVTLADYIGQDVAKSQNFKPVNFLPRSISTPASSNTPMQSSLDPPRLSIVFHPANSPDVMEGKNVSTLQNDDSFGKLKKTILKKLPSYGESLVLPKFSTDLIIPLSPAASEPCSPLPSLSEANSNNNTFDFASTLISKNDSIGTVLNIPNLTDCDLKPAFTVDINSSPAVSTRRHVSFLQSKQTNFEIPIANVPILKDENNMELSNLKIPDGIIVQSSTPPEISPVISRGSSIVPRKSSLHANIEKKVRHAVKLLYMIILMALMTVVMLVLMLIFASDLSIPTDLTCPTQDNYSFWYHFFAWIRWSFIFSLSYLFPIPLLT